MPKTPTDKIPAWGPGSTTSQLTYTGGSRMDRSSTPGDKDDTRARVMQDRYQGADSVVTDPPGDRLLESSMTRAVKHLNK